MVSAAQQEAWKILETAMKIEQDGEAFYNEAAAGTQDPRGKKLFQTLARDEVMHYETLRTVYESLRQEKGWPAVEAVEKDLGKVDTPHPIFPRPEGGQAAEASTHELEALERGIKAEKDSIELYSRGLKESEGNETARYLYSHLVEQEESHLAILQGELDYLRGTGFWFDIFEVDLEGL
jgi:rubrerythrin